MVFDERADTEDGDQVVWVLVKDGVVDEDIQVFLQGESAMQSAIDSYRLELDGTGRFLDEIDRAAALERFRRNLLRGRSVRVNGLGDGIRLVRRTVQP